MLKYIITLALITMLTPEAGAHTINGETVDIIDFGKISLNKLQCRDVARDSSIKRVCYDDNDNYLLVNVRGAHHHYCRIDSDTASELLSANSIIQYYIAEIRDSDDHDCINGGIPDQN